MNINLHIERLIVDDMDLDAGGRDQMGRAVKRQLLAQLNERGLAGGMGGLANQRSVKGGTISFKESDRPATTGQKIGEAIYKGIGNGE